MIEKELIETFSKLNDNEKRNQISSELEKLGLLLDGVHKQYGIEKMSDSLNSYDKVNHEGISNSEYFNLMYENIIYIRKDILTFVNKLLS